MPVNYQFSDNSTGEGALSVKDMAHARRGFIALSVAVGMPRLDRGTLDEFVRRTDLFQTYLGTVEGDDKGPVILGRRHFEALLPLATTNASVISRRGFDARINQERDACWTSQDLAALL